MTERDGATTNLSKVYWPETGTTKGDLIDYYRAVAPVMVPLVAGRAMTLLRCPDGIEGERFFTKNAPKSRPDWLSTVDIWAESSQRVVHYPIIDSAEALVWAANLGTVEFHVSPAAAGHPDQALYMVFDLDPGPPADASDCARVAIAIRKSLESDGLESLVKSSGSKGIHVLVPLNSSAGFAEVAQYAREIASHLAADDPDRVVIEMKKKLRDGKVFIDWSQNQRHKTTVAAYSVRARPQPTVSTPLTWDEVEASARTGAIAGLFPLMPEVESRVGRQGDELAALTTKSQSLPVVNGGRRGT